MKGIKKLVIFFLFGIMLTFSVRAPLCESIDPTDSEVIIKTSANNQYVIHNYTQAVISLRRGYNGIKENKCSCLRDIGGTENGLQKGNY